MADVMMGFWLTHETLSPVGVFLLLLASSSFLYTAGMVLNDVFDLEQDRRERPHRPLPSGRISYHFAESLGWTLLIAGVFAAALATWLNESHWIFFTDGWSFAMLGNAGPVTLAIILAASVVFYDRWLKRTWMGPLAMGSCRALNVLLGMSAASLTNVNTLVAGGIGLYIVGVTWFARREASSSKQLPLIGATLTMLAGISLLRWWPRLIPPDQLFATLQFEPASWTWAWILIALAISWRFVQAIFDPRPARVQAAVKSGILSIIVLDAVTVFAMRGPVPSTAILLLLVPTVALGAWIYST